MSSKDGFSAAKLSWEGDIPASQEYGDVYFSLIDGLEESRYVFLEANDLTTRLINHDDTVNNSSRPFIISEAGFGTGLNFLLSWNEWLSIPSEKRPRIHYISFEKHPINKSDLELSLSKWPQLKDLSRQLVDHYPTLIEGQHTVSFEDGCLVLTLVFGDIAKAAQNYKFSADCWYLDGFSPQKNPEMWSNELFNQVARLSKASTTFSTFAAASSVRKGLVNAGFDVKRRKGFGKKREMLHGSLQVERKQVAKSALNWSLPCPDSTKEVRQLVKQTDQSIENRVSKKFDVVVIGAGLAGCNTASSLSKRGLTVGLIDQCNGPVTGASGQSQLVMYAKFPSERNKLFNFIEHCLSHSMQHYQALQDSSVKSRFWHSCGVLQLAWNDKEADKQRRFADNVKLPSNFVRQIDAKLASLKSGIDQSCGGLWFENAGWLDPKAYTSHILNSKRSDNASIKTFFNEKVSLLEQNRNDTWLIETQLNRFEADNVVICNANEVKRFTQLNHLPTKPLRGQVTSIKPKTNSKPIPPTKCVLTGEGYLCPPIDGWHHFGATFNLDSVDTSTNQKDDQKNLDSIKQWNPLWLDGHRELNQFELRSNAGLRCTTPDYLPIVGAAPVFDKMIDDFAKLRVGANSCKHLYGTYHKGLYVNVGHGSKGTFTTPIAAEQIASEICGGVPPFNEPLRAMLSPARFIIKHLKQRRI